MTNAQKNRNISELAELLLRCLDTPSKSAVSDLKNIEGALHTAHSFGFAAGALFRKRKKKK